MNTKTKLINVSVALLLLGLSASARAEGAKVNAAAAAARADIGKTLGFVPQFFLKFPEEVLPGAWDEMKSLQLNPSTALPGTPSSVTIPSCTVTVNRAGSVKNPSAITSWVTSRRISSSVRWKTLSTSDRLMMPARCPSRSTTGSRPGASAERKANPSIAEDGNGGRSTPETAA